MRISDQFLNALRSTLNRLYDPDRLRRSPLASLLGVADQFDTASALQKILVDAIASMKPSDTGPLSSEAWTIYEVLFYRYVQQLTQQEVADQLGFGVRHLRRKQRVAIESLALHLYERYHLDADADAQVDADANLLDQLQGDYEVEDELSWLENAHPTLLTDLSLALQTATARAKPLADRMNVSLDVAIDEALPALLVHPVALKQIILNLLSLAIHRSTGGSVSLVTNHVGEEILIEVRGSDAQLPALTASQDDADTMHLARRMAALCGGTLRRLTDATVFLVELKLPVLQRKLILVLDDNQDFQQLLDRYVANTQYRVIATSNPERAIKMAEELDLAAILLDIMMPDVDGWEVLAKLRQHPATEHLPIIVCTILAQEDLALTLGADAFLRKPIAKPDLLVVLDAQLGRKVPTPH